MKDLHRCHSFRRSQPSRRLDLLWGRSGPTGGNRPWSPAEIHRVDGVDIIAGL